MKAIICCAGPAGLRNLLGWAWFGCASEITARLGCFGCARPDFWSQVAPTWMPGTAIIAIPLEMGIEIHKSHVSNKTVKNSACGPQVEAQIVPIVPSLSRVFPAAPTELQSAPKWSLGLSNWCTFPYILHDLSPASLKVGSGVQL